jgi:predicted DCC family thiol-disulfide oxidoreductase YuxK
MILVAKDTPIILFDGICNLCTGSVRFVIEHDSKRQFKFASLQSNIAKQLLKQVEEELPNLLGSVILIDEQGVWFKSGAALRIAGQLSGAWPLLKVLLLIPRPLRDWVYDFIGKRRYQWFGYTTTCWVPDTDMSERFLTDNDRLEQEGER